MIKYKNYIIVKLSNGYLITFKNIPLTLAKTLRQAKNIINSFEKDKSNNTFLTDHFELIHVK